MSKKEFYPSKYSLEDAILEAARYSGGIYVGDNYITKDHGGYIEVNIESLSAEKKHISFDIYYDESGKFTHWEKHN